MLGTHIMYDIIAALGHHEDLSSDSYT